MEPDERLAAADRMRERSGVLVVLFRQPCPLHSRQASTLLCTAMGGSARTPWIEESPCTLALVCDDGLSRA